MRVRYILIPIFTLASLFAQAQNMNNKQLGKILTELSDEIEGETGVWEFKINNMPMVCITDENNNRMRIISPVREIEDVTPKELKECMEANFHSALDVKYAVSNDIMWVAFIHPLAELSDEQVVSAVSQIYNASITYGSTYSSTELVFPKAEDAEKDPKQKSKKKTSKT